MRKIIGIGLYFIGMGFWVFCVFWMIPPLIIIALATYVFGVTREWPEFKYHWIWKYVREKVLKFTVEGDFPDCKDPVIWAIYPHGHFSLAPVFYWALNERFRHAKAAIHSCLFYLPVIGVLVGWLGAIHVTEDHMKQTLRDGYSIFMCPGGIADSHLTGNTIVKRNGFLRIARDMKCTVIPVWCPDERSYYLQWCPLGFTLQKWLFFPIPMFIFGRWWCPLLPRYVERSRIRIGTPIEVHTLDEGERMFWSEINRLQSNLYFFW